MPLISSTIPNLIGGVSQQPYNIRLPAQCEAMENCLPSVVEFLRRRPATKHIAKIMEAADIDSAAIHVINRDSSERYVAVAVNGQLKIFTTDGAEKPVTFEADRGYLSTSSPDTDIQFMTINDYTFVLNKTVAVAMDSASTSPTRQIEALVFIKQANYATDYHITIDSTTFTHTTHKDDNRDGNGVEYTTANHGEAFMKDTKLQDQNRYKLSSSTIAADLANQIRDTGDFDVRVEKSTLWIRRHNGQGFTAKASDSRSNSCISVVTDKVQRFSDLPTVAPQGYITEIIGDQSSSFDNYYVRFETNDGGGYDSGVWVETVKPGILTKFAASTMPHALVRNEDGSFTFKTLDWGKRTCGDEDSAPEPSFIGRRLSSIFFYRNRLGLLSNENCVLSEAGKFFNFFVSTVTTMVDSDLIDIAASHTKATSLYHVAPFSEGLILFSDQTQFILEHDDSLSVKTAAIKPITEFECSVAAQPIGAGKNIFFATSRGSYAGVREYFVEKDSSLTDASDVTSHVPHYIPGSIHKLVVSTNEDCLLALATEERNTVAFYKYFWNGQEKLQSSWSRWSFSGKVLSAAFLNSTLLLATLYNDGLYLESLNIEPGYTDADGAPFEFALDRKVTERGLQFITYDENTRQSTVTFPYPLSAEPLVVTRYNGTPAKLPPGVVFKTVSWSGNKAVVSGDCRNLPLYAGIPYRSLFAFSKQVMREDSGQGGKLAISEGRLQLRSFTLTYGDTGYFEVHVTPEYRQTDVHIFNGRVLGHGSNIIGAPSLHSGTYRFYPLSKADMVDISITSDSFLPFQITSAGWEGYFNIRSQRRA